MSKRGFFKDIISVSGTNTFNTLIRFLSGIILARILGPEDKGLYATIIVVPMMIVTLSELGVRRAVIQHIGEGKYSVNRIIASLSIFFIFTSIVGIAISAYVYISKDDPNITIPLILLALLTIPINLLNKYNNGILVGQQRYKVSNYLRSIPVIANLLFLIIFIWVLQLSVVGALIAVIGANLISSISGIIIISRKFKYSVGFDKELVKSLVSTGFVYALALFLARLNFKIDILLLSEWSTMAEVGYYSLGASFAEGWQAPFAVGAVILSTSANKNDANIVNDDLAKLFRFYLLTTIIVAIGVYFATPYALPLLYSKDFIPSIPVVQAILPAVILVIIGKIFSSRIAGLRKTYLLIYIYVPSLIINVVFNYFLIPTYGAMGAVYATLISYTFSFIILIIVYSKVTGTSFLELFAYKKSDFLFLKNIKKYRRK